MTKLTYRILLSLFTLCLIPVAAAQEATDPAMVLEEVLVTAQKRVESLQDVALTIQAYTGEQIEDAGLKSTDNLSQLVPGYQATRQIGGAVPYLRGVGTQNGAMGDEASIPQYIDGVYMASIYSTITYFNNVARVEVLKGPQGTLYGRNATGGLVSIVTKDPVRETSGQVGMSYGSYDTVNANLYATTGIGEYIAADIAVTYLNQGEGYGDNLFTGGESNYMDNTSIRSKWLITPSDDLTITLIGDYGSFGGSIASDRAPAPGTYGADGQLIYGGCLAGGGTPAECTAAAQAGATQAPADFQDVFANFRNFSGSRQWGLSGRIDYSFDALDFVSLTAYRHSDIRTFLDQDGTPVPFVDATLPRVEKQFSQEFQLLSNNDSKLAWILGFYYLDFKPAYEDFHLDGFLGGGVSSLNLPVSQYTTSYAVFGEMTYDFTEQWGLTLGGRYTWDERTLAGQTTLGFAGGGSLSFPAFDVSTKWDEPTWKVTLDYKPSDNVMFYGTYSRGFKSGVYNSVVTGPAPGAPVNPEILDAYELGFKSFLADGRMRLNGAAFYYDYTDLQLVSIDAGITFLRNATSAEVYGGELELGYLLTENFEINAGAAYLESEYGNFSCTTTAPNPIGGGIVTETNCKGNDLIRAPNFTGNVGAAYTVPMASGSFKATMNWYFNGGFYWEPDNVLEQDAYNVLNAELSWTNADGNMRIRVFGANLTDEKYYWYSNSGGLGFQISAAPPLTFGAGVDFYW